MGHGRLGWPGACPERSGRILVPMQPAYYNRKPSLERSYVLTESKPLFPFGFGLSYTSFRFSNLRVEPARIGTGGTATVASLLTSPYASGPWL